MAANNEAMQALLPNRKERAIQLIMARKRALLEAVDANTRLANLFCLLGVLDVLCHDVENDLFDTFYEWDTYLDRFIANAVFINNPPFGELKSHCPHPDSNNTSGFNLFFRTPAFPYSLAALFFVLIIVFATLALPGFPAICVLYGISFFWGMRSSNSYHDCDFQPRNSPLTVSNLTAEDHRELVRLIVNAVEAFHNPEIANNQELNNIVRNILHMSGMIQPQQIATLCMRPANYRFLEIFGSVSLSRYLQQKGLGQYFLENIAQSLNQPPANPVSMAMHQPPAQPIPHPRPRGGGILPGSAANIAIPNARAEGLASANDQANAANFSFQ